MSLFFLGSITWCILPIVFADNPLAQNASLAAGQCLMGISGVIVAIYMTWLSRKLSGILSQALEMSPDNKEFLALKVKLAKFTRFVLSSAINGGLVAAAIPIWMIVSSSLDGHGMSFFMYVWTLFLTPMEAYVTLLLWWMSKKIGGEIVTPQESVNLGSSGGKKSQSQQEEAAAA